MAGSRGTCVLLPGAPGSARPRRGGKHPNAVPDRPRSSPVRRANRRPSGSPWSAPDGPGPAAGRELWRPHRSRTKLTVQASTLSSTPGSTNGPLRRHAALARRNRGVVASQRRSAGRPRARSRPGRARGWGTPRSLRPHGEADIDRIDLAGRCSLSPRGRRSHGFACFRGAARGGFAAARALMGDSGPRRLGATPLAGASRRCAAHDDGASSSRRVEPETRPALRDSVLASLAPTSREATTSDLQDR